VRIDYKEALWLATQGGARALGLEGVAGSFHPGKAFDALLVDPMSGGGGGLMVFYPEDDSLEDVVQKFVNTGDDR